MEKEQRVKSHKRKKFYSDDCEELMAESALKRREAFRRVSRKA